MAGEGHGCNNVGTSPVEFGYDGVGCCVMSLTREALEEVGIARRGRGPGTTCTITCTCSCLLDRAYHFKLIFLPICFEGGKTKCTVLLPHCCCCAVKLSYFRPYTVVN